jgi:hypothetical protein
MRSIAWVYGKVGRSERTSTSSGREPRTAATGNKEDPVEDKDRRVPDTEEEADVEAHRRVLGAQEEGEDARRESDDDPDVEGHRLVPRTEI